MFNLFIYIWLIEYINKCKFDIIKKLFKKSKMEILKFKIIIKCFYICSIFV